MTQNICKILSIHFRRRHVGGLPRFDAFLIAITVVTILLTPIFSQSQSQSRNRPDSLKIYLEKGGAELKNRDFKAAEKSFQRALAFDNASVNALQNLGFLCTLRGDFPASKSYLERAINAGAKNVEVYSNLGAVHKELKEYSKAVDAYAIAHRLDTTNVDVRKNFGAALLSVGKFDDALVQLKIASKLKPEDGEAFFLIGNCFSAKRNFADAVASYKFAFDSKYNTPELRINFAIALDAVGDVWNAEEQFGNAVAMAPDNLEYRQRYGVFYIKTSHFDEAIKLFKENLRRDPGYINSHVGLGAAFAYQGKSEAARTEYEKVRARDASKARTMQSMMEQGERYFREVDSLKKAESLKPRPVGPSEKKKTDSTAAPSTKPTTP